MDEFDELRLIYDVAPPLFERNAQHLPGSVVPVPRMVWEGMRKVEKRGLYSRHSIHVVGESKTPVMPNVRGWHDKTAFADSFSITRVR